MMVIWLGNVWYWWAVPALTLVNENIKQVDCTDAVPLSKPFYSVTSVHCQCADDHLNGAEGEKGEEEDHSKQHCQHGLTGVVKEINETKTVIIWW